jgi:hypothetical protein
MSRYYFCSVSGFHKAMENGYDNAENRTKSKATNVMLLLAVIQAYELSIVVAFLFDSTSHL